MSTTQIRHVETLLHASIEMAYLRGQKDATEDRPPAQPDGPYMRGYISVYGPLDRIRRKRP